MRVLLLLVLLSGGVAVAQANKVDAFNAWFAKNSVSSKLKVADFGTGMGRGVVATEAVRRGDLVLSFPISMSLRPRDLRDTSIGPHTSDVTSQTDQLVLTLMCERFHLHASHPS